MTKLPNKEEKSMTTSAMPNKDHSTSLRLPRWIAPTVLAALFLLAHVAAPWHLSTLSTRHGWTGRRPGHKNRLALLLLVPGLASTLWLIAQHYRASPRTFVEFKPTPKLLMRSPYALSRNPMYLSELLMWFGWAIFYGSIPVLIGFLLWLAAFKYLIVPWEERDLEARFGEAYRQYKLTTPRWFGRHSESSS
jgi:protein-S-isoprenylcysteine O-methyltransferase Ste14